VPLAPQPCSPNSSEPGDAALATRPVSGIKVVCHAGGVWRDVAHDSDDPSVLDGRAVDESPGRFEIRLLGHFTVLHGGERMPDTAIGSRKARTLLKRLLVAGERVVSVDALAEAVWSAAPPDQPERHLATLVSRLRAALGPEVMVREGEGYRFGGGLSYLVDLAEAGRLAGEAETRLAAGEAGLARSAAGRASRLLERGELLADEPYAEWAAPARSEVASLVRRVRRCAWAAALAVHDPDAAAHEAEAALAAEPFNEEACRALMRAHQEQGSPGLALAAYERLRVVLADELGADPSEQTRELHRAILRAERAGAGQAAGALPVGRPGAVPDGDPGLVGREAEVGRLRQVWSRACAGGAGMVLLVGEAGIGKTSLAGEAVRLARGTGGSVARARCYETERSLFLQPLADALRPVVVSSSPDLVREAVGAGAAGLAQIIAEVASVMPVAAHHPASPELERRRVFEAVAGFIRALAGRQPVLLFLDDLHLAGSSTLEFLHFLTRRAAGSRLLVLATARVEEGTEVLDALGAVAQRWDIGPLPETAVRELADRSGLAGRTTEIMERTRGHSLFVVETLRAMAEQPADRAVTVPDSLRAAVLARLRRAGASVEELLQAAATLGGSFAPELLAALTDQPAGEVARWAAAAARARLFSEAGSAYEFANDLIQEIAYQATPLPIRVARHRRAAELLADQPAAVATHASRAGDWGAATEAYLRAAGAASDRYALRDAERLLKEAIQAARRADDPVGVTRARLARGRVREALTDYQGAFEDHRAAADLARSHRRPDLELAALRQLGGDLLVGLRRPVRECIPYLEAALSLAETTGDVPGQVDILGRLAVIWTNRLRFDQAESHAQQAQALAQADSGHDEAVRAVALDAVKTTLAYRGEIGQLTDVLPRLAACLPANRDLALRVWASFEEALPSLARAEWAAAATAVDKAIALTRETGFVAYESPFLAHLAWIERARGRYGVALRLGRQAVRLAEGTGHPWWVALAGSALGWTLTEIGALDEAGACLEEALRVAERDATEGYLVRCLGHLAWVQSLRGDRDRAAMLAARVERMITEATGWPGLHVAHAALAAATAWIELGEPAGAERLAAPVAGAARPAGWVELVAWADLLLARCRVAQDSPGAAELAGAALAGAREHELPGLAWQAGGLLAGLATTAGDRQSHLDAAGSTLDRLAASLGEGGGSFRARGGDRLRSLVQSVGRRGPRISSASTME
jgi:DNA-binding SARP family transcriptional activator/tetratricopeptide (TPR) repeat protein